MINWHDYFLYSDGALISIMRRRGAKYMKPAGRKNASCGYIEVMVNISGIRLIALYGKCITEPYPTEWR